MVPEYVLLLHQAHRASQSIDQPLGHWGGDGEGVCASTVGIKEEQRLDQVEDLTKALRHKKILNNKVSCEIDHLREFAEFPRKMVKNLLGDANAR